MSILQELRLGARLSAPASGNPLDVPRVIYDFDIRWRLRLAGGALSDPRNRI